MYAAGACVTESMGETECAVYPDKKETAETKRFPPEKMPDGNEGLYTTLPCVFACP